MVAASRIHLPPELWLDIFRFATYSPKLYSAEHQPFEPSPWDDTTHHDTLMLKYSIALVCRLWRALSVKMLYEDIEIAERSGTLQHTLESDSDSDSDDEGSSSSKVGGWVRRACLSYTQSATPTYQSLPCLDILRHCPHLEVLVRPPLGWDKTFSLRYEFPAGALPPLPTVKRLDWWHNDSASRSGGINSLDDVLLSLPQLEYLSLAGDMDFTSIKQRRLNLPSLRVLALRKVNPIFVRQVCYWTLPSLNHVVIDAPPRSDSLRAIWETFGSTVRQIEFGKHMRYMVEDYISQCLSQCPELHTLNYHVFFTSPPHIPTAHFYPSLKRVGLHARPNMSLSAHGEDPHGLKHVLRHVEAFGRKEFPELKEFVLYGEEWNEIGAREEFEMLEVAVREQERIIVFAW